MASSSPPIRPVAEVLGAGWRRGFELDPDLTVSEWAQLHRMVPSEAGSGLVPWDNALTPYLVEIMDRLSCREPSRRIVFLGSAQIGKSSVGDNWLGYVMHHAPGPVLMVVQTQEAARNANRKRIVPMIRACPQLQEKIHRPSSRDSGNSMFYKEFDGGSLALTWASSPAGLRMMATRYVFCDEVDGYPEDVGGEGDPLWLAERGTATFQRSKTYIVSTPTIKGHSRIEKEYFRTDQRRYFVPCPECGDMDWIEFRRRIVWENDDPATVRLVCLACGARIPEHRKTWMLAHGEWRPTAVSRDGTLGYYINALYAPLGWKTSWEFIVQKFLGAKNNPAELKVFVNHFLGETYEERIDEAIEANVLAARAKRYAGEVPTGVGVLVAAVDVQGDRLEWAVKGYGAAEESWLIAVGQVLGDPVEERTWFELDQQLQQEFTHEQGRKMRVECVTVDSGGHHAEQVYRFCKARQGRRVFAIKGGSEGGKPLVGRPSMHNRYRTPLFTLCVDTGKETVYSRMRIGAPGPGYMHLPDWVELEYLEQLTAETPLRKYVKGRGSIRVWAKRRERNEALDLEVYCLAALNILGPALAKDLPRRAAYFAQPVAESSQEKPPEVATPSSPRTRRRTPKPGGWMSRLRG